MALTVSRFRPGILAFVFLSVMLSAQAAIAQTIETVAGNGGQGYSGSGGPALEASINDPSSIVAIPAGGFYFAGYSTVHKVDTTGTITMIAGNGTPTGGSAGFSGDGGPATLANFADITGLALNASGEIYLAHRFKSIIRRIDADGIVTTVAGTGFNAWSNEPGPALERPLRFPSALAFAPNGTLYITDRSSIRKIDTNGVMSLVGGLATVGFGGDGGPVESAQFNNLTGIAIGADGSLYVADTGNARLRRIGPDGIVTTVHDGSVPRGLAIDVRGDLYYINDGSHRVERFTRQGQVQPVAGNGTAGFSGDGGLALEAQLDSPVNLALDAARNVYVADYVNERVRLVRPAVPSEPQAPIVAPWYSSANVTVVPWTHPGGHSTIEYQVVSTPAANVSLRFNANGGLTHNFPQLNPGTSYTFKVRAIYDRTIEGPWSPDSEPLVVPEPRTPPQIEDVSVVEGDSGESHLVYTVSLGYTALDDILFDFRAEAAGIAGPDDFLAVDFEDLVIQTGRRSTTVSVPVYGDLLPEDTEDLLVYLYMDGSIVDIARGEIIDDDAAEQAFVGTEDRFTAWENWQPQVLDVLENDHFQVSQLSGGRLETVEAPLRGSVALDDAGTPATAADDTFVYTPAADWAGEDVFTYRACTSANVCFEALATVRVHMFTERTLSNGHAGRDSRTSTAPRTADRLRFLATPLRELRRDDLLLLGDPTPSTPWDHGGAGTVTSVRTLAASAVATRWRIYATAGMPNDHATNLYVGHDEDEDGIADPEEVGCVVSIRTPWNFCELTIEVQAGVSSDYWVLAHNTGSETFTVDIHAGAAPLVAGDGTLMASGPGKIVKGDSLRLVTAYDDPTMVLDDRRVGFIRVLSGEEELDLVPFVAISSNLPTTALALKEGEPQTLRVAAGAAQDRVFIDVPAGSSSLDVTMQSAPGVELHLSRAETMSSPRIDAAPARANAVATGVADANGQLTLGVSGGQMQSGRWYVTPVNPTDATVTVALTPVITGTAPVVRPGSYFNAARAGHGVFLYPAGDSWAGIWYTFESDGKPTWYYLQGTKPTDNGIWTGTLYTSSWQGTTNHLVDTGHVTVTPTGPDAFIFTHDLTGITGSETMSALGRGCPTLGGTPLDISSHWFDPASAGVGYSVQMWNNYEFYAAFVYDAQGVARFLNAESDVFSGADATLPLTQITGFCPTCARNADPTRQAIGTLRRVISGGSLQRIEVNGTYVGGVPGTWTGNDTVQPLGGPGTTQGCGL